MEERIRFEARSSDLETNLLSSGDTVGAKTFASVPLSSQPLVSQPPRSFHALKEEFSLSEETFSSFKDRFQFPKETKVCLPCSGKKSCAFAHDEVCFY